MNYVFLGIWGMAAFTQLLATFGVMTDINLMVWLYVVGLLGGLATGVTGVFYFLAYDTAYTNKEDTSNTSLVIIASRIVFNEVWAEVVEFGIK